MPYLKKKPKFIETDILFVKVMNLFVGGHDEIATLAKRMREEGKKRGHVGSETKRSDDVMADGAYWENTLWSTKQHKKKF